jgi:hypothetical protein
MKDVETRLITHITEVETRLETRITEVEIQLEKQMLQLESRLITRLGAITVGSISIAVAILSALHMIN